jgi:hypothetical protein
LKQGRELPSVVAHFVGDVRGSWWSHPKGKAIFAALEDLADSPDALLMKLVLGKDTFVHRRLWPALFAVGNAREEWQTRKLDGAAQALLARVEREGTVNSAGEAGKALARALLCVSRQEHTESGKHSTVLESWTHWAPRTRSARSTCPPPRAAARSRTRSSGSARRSTCCRGSARGDRDGERG